MGEFSFVPSEPIRHQVELYTARFFIHGTISGPFKRTSDLMNRKDTNYLQVDGAIITPVGQTADPSKMSTPLMVGRSHIHLAASAPQEPASRKQEGPAVVSREYFVQKVARPCYVLTDTYVIYGLCHLVEGSTLESYLHAHDTFIPLTKTTVYLVSRPNSPWQRDLVIVNKDKLEVMYFAEE